MTAADDRADRGKRPLTRPQTKALLAAAGRMRGVLDALPAESDSPRDAVVRRRVEGAIAAAELAAGEPSPRLATEPDRHALQDTDD